MDEKDQNAAQQRTQNRGKKAERKNVSLYCMRVKNGLDWIGLDSIGLEVDTMAI